MELTDVLAMAIFPDRSGADVEVCAVVDRVLDRLDAAGFEVRKRPAQQIMASDGISSLVPANDNRPPPAGMQRWPEPPLAPDSPPIRTLPETGWLGPDKPKLPKS